MKKVISIAIVENQEEDKNVLESYIIRVLYKEVSDRFI